MSGALLGKDTEREFRNSKRSKGKGEGPSKLTNLGRTILLSLICLFSVGSLTTGATANAAIWDLKDQMVAKIMNVCNPNAVPYTTDTKSWIDSALGSTTNRPLPEKNNAEGDVWSTYNPMLANNGSSYIATAPDANPGDELNNGNVTRAWINLLSAQKDDQWLYYDSWSNRSKVKTTDAEWWNAFRGTGDRNMYPADPTSANAAYYNAPTVALQGAYASAPVWVVHPTYTRYGFETLDWTTYGASCYSPERYFNVIPSTMYWFLVQIPTLITFGMLRITLGSELSGVFYTFVYPLTSLIGKFISPWAALIAIVIGLPFIWVKSKGSIQKLLGGATWIAAMIFAITQLTTHAKSFTQFSQGLVVKVSGTMACTIANQAFTDGVTTIALSPAEVKQYQKVPQYDSHGNVMTDADGNTIYTTQQTLEDSVKQNATDGSTNIKASITTQDIKDLAGTSGNATTPCGSYLDGIYNAFWIGIPLQVWAEGEVGSAQAARDRVSQTKQKIGWYQAILNSMYINPNDSVGRAQIQSTSRWNDGGYTASVEDDASYNMGKPAQWTLDGHDDDVFGDKVNDLDDKKATVWKTVPFLLNVKFMCKDQTSGTMEKSGMNGADNAGDYAANKWLYDGTCITGGDGGLIDGLMGVNYMDRVALTIVGGALSLIVFFFTVGICIYIGYQKFVWGFMLMFAPIFLGIAAFPDDKRRDFFRKYAEFCISNVVKQIVAVMVLVVTVTALGRIVFPNAMDVGGVQFYVPWVLKPFVALMFLLAAVMFAFPLKKIMVGAVKGDSSVVGKTAKGVEDATKTAAGLAAAGAVIAATGGGGAALGTAALKGAGRAAQSVAYRKGGLTGAVASAAGQAAEDKASGITTEANKAAIAAGLPTTERGLLGEMKRDRALKNMKGSKGLSQKAALAANKLAAQKGEALPYAVDAAGNLTKAGKKKALKDFVGAQKGNFTKSPEFTALARNKEMQAAKAEAARTALLPEFTDKDGKVDELGLGLAVNRQLGRENSNMLNRQKKLGNELLKADKALPAEERQYLDKDGKLTADGQSKLLTDVRALDGNAVNAANGALAHELLAKNPEKYDQFVTAENPNGNYMAALADANRKNFGDHNALIGNKPMSNGILGGEAIQQLDGSQAYIAAGAPVVGEELSPIAAAAEVENIGSALNTLSPAAQSAVSKYSEVLQNPDATHEELAGAHADAMKAIHASTGLTDGSKIVNDKVLAPVNDHGMNLSPDAVREVASTLPETSVALRQSLENYAGALESGEAGSPKAQQALNDVKAAAAHEDAGVYASVAQSMPMPAATLATPTATVPAPMALAPSVDAPAAVQGAEERTDTPVSGGTTSPATLAPASNDTAPAAPAQNADQPTAVLPSVDGSATEVNGLSGAAQPTDAPDAPSVTSGDTVNEVSSGTPTVPNTLAGSTAESAVDGSANVPTAPVDGQTGIPAPLAPSVGGDTNVTAPSVTGNVAPEAALDASGNASTGTPTAPNVDGNAPVAPVAGSANGSGSLPAPDANGTGSPAINAPEKSVLAGETPQVGTTPVAPSVTGEALAPSVTSAPDATAPDASASSVDAPSTSVPLAPAVNGEVPSAPSIVGEATGTTASLTPASGEATATPVAPLAPATQTDTAQPAANSDSAPAPSLAGTPAAPEAATTTPVAPLAGGVDVGSAAPAVNAPEAPASAPAVTPNVAAPLSPSVGEAPSVPSAQASVPSGTAPLAPSSEPTSPATAESAPATPAVTDSGATAAPLAAARNEAPRDEQPAAQEPRSEAAPSSLADSVTPTVAAPYVAPRGDDRRDEVAAPMESNEPLERSSEPQRGYSEPTRLTDDRHYDDRRDEARDDRRYDDDRRSDSYEDRGYDVPSPRREDRSASLSPAPATYDEEYNREHYVSREPRPEDSDKQYLFVAPNDYVTPDQVLDSKVFLDENNDYRGSMDTPLGLAIVEHRERVERWTEGNVVKGEKSDRNSDLTREMKDYSLPELLPEQLSELDELARQRSNERIAERSLLNDTNADLLSSESVRFEGRTQDDDYDRRYDVPRTSELGSGATAVTGGLLSGLGDAFRARKDRIEDKNREVKESQEKVKQAVEEQAQADQENYDEAVKYEREKKIAIEKERREATALYAKTLRQIQQIEKSMNESKAAREELLQAMSSMDSASEEWKAAEGLADDLDRQVRDLEGDVSNRKTFLGELKSKLGM